MATFNDNEAGSSVRTKINAAITTVDGLGAGDNLLMTAAERANLGNQSGTNTGDQDLSGLQAEPSEGAFANGDKTKLDGIATGATANTGALADLNTVDTAQIDNDAVTIAKLAATGTASSSTFLRGDNTWATPAGSGDVAKVGTPANNQLGVWTGDGTIEGDTNLQWDGTDLSVSGNVVLHEGSGTTITAATSVGADSIIFYDDSDSDAVKSTTVTNFISDNSLLQNVSEDATPTLGGDLDGGGNEIANFIGSVVTSVSGTLTVAAHSGNTIKTSGNVTVPTTAGFQCFIIAGGAHTVTFNSTTSAAMATGDIMSVVVESGTVIHAVLTAAADKVSFS